MAMKLEEIEQHLRSLEVHYERKGQQLIAGFPTREFVNPSGTKGVLLSISVSSDGELFRVVAPNAMSATGLYADLVLRACAMVQYRTPCVQFEFDDESAELRPVIEIPLADGTLTPAQVNQCLRFLVVILDDSYTMLQKAAINGEVEFPEVMMSKREKLISGLRQRIRELQASSPNSPEALELKKFLAMLVDGPA